MITTILFDLDGTLLPMDQTVFTNDYCTRLAKRIAPFGYDPKSVVKALWIGVKAMVENDGTCTNEERFWQAFGSILGNSIREHEVALDDFYRTEFNEVAKVCGYTEQARKLIDWLKEQGYRIVLATNPFFPAIATESRIRWAGLSPDDFELYTTFEDFSYCKPNLKYYEEILSKIGCKPEECLMVGNDVGDDMVTESLGMKVFLLTDCLINEIGKDINLYPHGSFKELFEFISALR